jgi:hypothetical protein
MGSVRDITSDPYRTHRRAQLAHPAYSNSTYSRPVFMPSIGDRRMFGGRWTDFEPIERASYADPHKMSR